MRFLKTALGLGLTLCLTQSLLAQDKKIAIVTINVDKQIGAEKLGQNAQALKTILEMANDPNFDLTPAIDRFEEAFTGELAKEFPFTFIDSKEITGNAAYKEYESPWVSDESYLTIQPQGDYKMLARRVLGIAGEDMKATLEMFPEADAVMFLDLSYEFTSISAMGMGAAQVRAEINMVAFNRDYKKVFDIYEGSTSSKKVPLVSGYPVMKPEKIQPLCISATDNLIKDLRKNMKKIVKKSNKKL